MLASLVGTITVIILIFARGFRVNALNAIIIGFFVVATLPIVLTMSAEIAGEKFAGIGSAFLQLLGNGAAVILVPTIEALHMRTTTYKIPPHSACVSFWACFLRGDSDEGNLSYGLKFHYSFYYSKQFLVTSLFKEQSNYKFW